MHVALTIAGSDSGGGAGIQADLKSFAACGVYGTSALTAITAQNTQGVTAAFELPPDLVRAQIMAVFNDFSVDAAKTGMLASTTIIEAVVDSLYQREFTRLVVDPVMVTKSGDPLLRPDAITALREQLLPLALVVTPNIPEAEVLVNGAITTEEQRHEAARAIHAMGPRYVLVKGGHLVGDDCADLLYDGQEFSLFHAPRLHTTNTHGTGCTFSAAITARLAQGHDIPEAVRQAKTYVTGAIAHAPGLGYGHGPLHHFWRMTPRENAEER